MVSAKLFPSRADLTPNMYRIVRKCILRSHGSGALVHCGCTLENSCNHVGYMSILFGHPGTLLTAVVRFGLTTTNTTLLVAFTTNTIMRNARRCGREGINFTVYHMRIGYVTDSVSL
jgi:hypothetical protein